MLPGSKTTVTGFDVILLVGLTVAEESLDEKERDADNHQ